LKTVLTAVLGRFDYAIYCCNRIASVILIRYPNVWSFKILTAVSIARLNSPTDHVIYYAAFAVRITTIHIDYRARRLEDSISRFIRLFGDWGKPNV